MKSLNAWSQKLIFWFTHSTIDFSPSESFAPENEHNNDPIDSDLFPDRVGDDENVENNLVTEEDEGEYLLSTDILDDVKDFDSDDEFVCWSFVDFQSCFFRRVRHFLGFNV